MTISIIEISFSLGLFANAALFVPQARRMIINRDAKNVSLVTFFGFWFIQLVTILHGFLRKDYLLACGILISMITCGYVIFLIIYYKFRNKYTE